MDKKHLPSTSVDAFNQSHELAKAHKEKIVEALKELGFANYEQIASHLSMDKHAIGRRLSELETDQKIYKSGITKPTSSGRSAFCYVLTGQVSDSKEKRRMAKKSAPKQFIQQTLL